MGYSKNQKAAKDFDPLWKKDPVMLPFRAAVREGRFPGYAGPADRKAAEGLSKYLITDMYAKAVQGAPVEDAVKWADAEYKSIHAA
jgi:multiple sugar transport system substrate-binding protein